VSVGIVCDFSASSRGLLLCILLAVAVEEAAVSSDFGVPTGVLRLAGLVQKIVIESCSEGTKKGVRETSCPIVYFF